MKMIMKEFIFTGKRIDNGNNISGHLITTEVINDNNKLEEKSFIIEEATHDMSTSECDILSCYGHQVEINSIKLKN